MFILKRILSGAFLLFILHYPTLSLKRLSQFQMFRLPKKSHTTFEIAKGVDFTVEDYMLGWLTTYKRIELKSYDTLESTIQHQIIPHFKGM